LRRSFMIETSISVNPNGRSDTICRLSCSVFEERTLLLETDFSKNLVR
jgi:hypothetical protein